MRRHTLLLLAAAVLTAGCEVGIQHQLALGPQSGDDQLTVTVHTVGAATDALAAADRLEQLTGTLERATGQPVTTEQDGDRYQWQFTPERGQLPELSPLTGLADLRISENNGTAAVAATFVTPEQLLDMYDEATDDPALAAAAAASTDLTLTVRAPRGVDVAAAPDPVQTTQVGNTVAFTIAANQLDTPVTITADGHRTTTAPWTPLAVAAVVVLALGMWAARSRSRRQ